MKKKTLGIVLSAGFILSSGIALTACGGGEEQVKQVDFVTISYADNTYSTNYNSQTKTFNFYTGTAVNFSASDFSVVITYTDGTTQTLKQGDFNVDLSNIPSGALEEGYYYLSVSDGQGISEQFTIIVSDQQINNLAGIDETIKFSYDGNEKDVIAKLDQLQSEAGKPTITELMGQNGLLTIAQNSDTTATNAGYYVVSFELPDGYVFENGNHTQTISWEIEKARIPMPSVKMDGQVVPSNQEIELTYKHQHSGSDFVGVEQDIDLDFGDYDNDVINEVVEISGDKGTNVGTYTCWVRIKDQYQDNYTFDVNEHDYNYSESVKAWSISPLKISKPTIEHGDEYHYTYSASNAIEPVIDYHGLADLFAVSGTTSANYASDTPYSFNISLKSEDLSNNYRWQDGSTIYPLYFSYFVDKADYELPDDINENLFMEVNYGLDLCILYNGNYESSNFTAATKTYLKENGFMDEEDQAVGYFEWVGEGAPTIDHATDEGEYIEAQVTYTKDYNNYNPSDPISVKIKVNKRKIIIENLEWQKQGNYYYNGQAKTNTLSSFYNFNPYVDKNEDGDADVTIASTTYFKKVDEQWQEVAECVDAGEYKSVISFNVPANYETDDVESEWTIEKGNLSIEVNNNCWYGTAIDKDVQYYNGNISLVEADGEEREVRTILLNPYAHASNEENGQWTWVEVPSAVSISYTYYKWNESTWTEIQASQIKDVGRFKAVANLTYDTDNFNIDGEEYPATAETEVEILSRTIDCSIATWEDQDEFVYDGSFSGDYPKAILPKGVYASYYFYNSMGGQSWAYSSVGNYSVSVQSLSPIGAWEELVTLVNTEAIVGYVNRKAYHIVSREVQASDFGWNIVRNGNNYESLSNDNSQPIIIESNGTDTTEFRISGSYSWDVDVEYTTIARTANPNEFRTTATITTREGNNNVTIAGDSIVMYIDWNIDIVVTNNLSKTYDGTPVIAPEYVTHDELTQNQNVVIEYKLTTDNEDAYTTQTPIEPGDYVARVRVVEEESGETHTVCYASKYFTIDKITPEYATPTGLTATYGQRLGDVTLPDGFTWFYDTYTSVGEVGTNKFLAVYTPDDTDHYKTLYDVEVEIEVTNV